jgi:hypothetical protein
MARSEGRLEPLERRVLLAAAAPIVSTLTEADGTRVTASLAGPGTLDASVSRGLTVLRLDGTTERSTLTVTSDPATGAATIDSIHVNGSLGRLLAGDAVLADSVIVTGALRQAVLGDVTADAAAQLPATVRIGAGRRTTLSLGRVKDLDIDAPAVAFAAVTARSWEDDPANGRQRFVAASVARFSVGANASFDLYADRIGAVAVTGDLTDSKIMVLPGAAGGPQGQGQGQAPGLASLSVGGAMRRTWVNTLADVGQVTTGGMFDSVIAAGVAYAETSPGVFEQPLPAKAAFSDVGSFTGKYAIRSVTVNDRVGQDYAFANSRVGAYRVGSVRIDGVRSDNGGRPFGVAAYQLNRLLRKFGGADADKNDDINPPTDFVARQIFAPLVFRPAPGGYGGYYGGGGPNGGYVAISIVNNQLDYTIVPFDEGGVQVGTVANHLSAAGVFPNPAATGIFLNPDNTYDARDAAGAVVVPPAPLADVILALAGKPGVSMKAEVKGPVGTDDGSLTFLSTSEGAEVVIPVPRTPVRYQPPSGPPGSFVPALAVPTQSELVAALRAGGTEVQEFTRPLVRLRFEGVEVARMFDDTTLRRVRLIADHTYGLSDGRNVLAVGASLPDVLLGAEGPRLGGRQRLPAWVVWSDHKVTVYGLSRGGTAVFDLAQENVIDPAGAVFTTPGAGEFLAWMRQHGVRVEDFVG